ncbi:MAG TPA: chaperone modulator CbpM [archaeon]|nr:chaperone modulator CbpM [archaeon]
MAWDEVEMRICVAAVVEDETEGLTADELAARCGLHPAALEPYIRVGVVSCDASSGRFPMTTATRLRKAIRLRRDLGVNLAAVGIVLDLLDRLEVMGLEVERLRAELSRTMEGPATPSD